MSERSDSSHLERRQEAFRQRTADLEARGAAHSVGRRIWPADPRTALVMSTPHRAQDAGELVDTLAGQLFEWLDEDGTP